LDPSLIPRLEAAYLHAQDPSLRPYGLVQDDGG